MEQAFSNARTFDCGNRSVLFIDTEYAGVEIK